MNDAHPAYISPITPTFLKTFLMQRASLGCTRPTSTFPDILVFFFYWFQCWSFWFLNGCTERESDGEMGGAKFMNKLRVHLFVGELPMFMDKAGCREQRQRQTNAEASCFYLLFWDRFPCFRVLCMWHVVQERFPIQLHQYQLIKISSGIQHVVISYPYDMACISRGCFHFHFVLFLFVLFASFCFCFRSE